MHRASSLDSVLLRALGVIALLAILSTSCTYPATAVIVTLGSDIAPSRLHTIRAFVRRGEAIPQSGTMPSHEWRTDTLDGGSFLPASFTVVPTASDPRDVRVTLVVEADLDASSGGGVPVTIRRIARFATTPRTTTEIGFWLASRCGDPATGCTSVSDPAACTVSARCEEQGLTCGDDGSCTTTEVRPHEPMGLPEAGPDVPAMPDAPDASTVPDPVQPRFAINSYHACAIDDAGGVRCWGSNASGQLGDATVGIRTAPIATPVLDHAIAVATGRDFTCALRDDATVHCWGANSVGQLGDGTSTRRSQPRPVPGVSGAIAIAAGQTHACAVLANGGVMCWGYGLDGQLGHGASRVEYSPVSVSGITDAAGVITAMWLHTCVARRDGTAACWGDNDHGQLGGDSPTGPGATSNVPVAVAGLTDVVTIGAGNEHSCATRRDGAVVCWGRSDFGELGPPTSPSGPPPAQFRIVDGLGGPAAAVSVGLGFSCALRRDGAVRCWGINDSYVVTDQPIRAVPTPMAATLPQPAVALTAGGLSACARDASGVISCWGSNSYRQLGDGSIFTGGATASTVPLSGAGTEIAVGAAHACARTASGVFCWGPNNYGQLGDVGPSPPDPRPLGVTGGVQLALGQDGTLVRLVDGTVRTWGHGAGAAGEGRVFTLPATADEVAAGGFHGCARNGNSVWCWGDNAHGEVGDGTTIERLASVPVDLAGASVVQLALGDAFSCALTGAAGARSVMCWGANESGQLGDGTTTERHLPVTATISGDIEEITAGIAHACARRSTGVVSCWGANANGELGNGAMSPRSTSPVDVAMLADASHIDAGDRFTCAVRTTGNLVCWGANPNGELGVNGVANAAMPIASTAVPTADVSAIAAGYGFACVLRTGGTVQCWGTPIDGRLGDGSASRTIPRAVANWP